MMTGKNHPGRIATIAGMLLLSVPASADPYDKNAKRQPLLSDTPWPSARAAGMAEAMAGSADMQDAVYYNPAGIGGLYPQGKGPVFSGIYFPYAAFSSHGPFSMDRELNARNAGKNARITQAVAEAKGNTSSYNRYALVPSVHFNRFFLGYSYDYQVAAQHLGQDPASGQEQVRYVERQAYGPNVGFSATDDQHRVIFGLSGQQRNWLEATGEGPAALFNDPAQVNALIDRQRWQGTSANAGLVVRMPQRSFVLQWYAVGRDISGTRMVRQDDSHETTLIPEDITSGFSFYRHWEKGYSLSLNTEAGYLTRHDMPSARKWRVGLEFLGGEKMGILSDWGLRAGMRDQGPSVGAHINVGLIGLEYGVSSEDVGTETKRMIEQRSTGIISINVAE